MRRLIPALLFMVLVAASLGGCSGGDMTTDGTDSLVTATKGAGAPGVDEPAAAYAMPGLPADALQPWERNGADVEAYAPARMASAISADEFFSPGVERELDGGDAAERGEALRLESSGSGQLRLSYAIYRFPLSADQPGTISAYVNPLRRGDGGDSSYWVGVSDYAKGQWRWQGPLKGSLTRFSLPAGQFTSPFGNCFVAVAVFDGDEAEIVAAGCSTRDSDDSAAPQAPGLVQLTALAGQLQVDWVPVIASDIAGYNVYYSNKDFPDHKSVGVKRLPLLSAEPRALLPASGDMYVRITAVDTSGNESSSSQLAFATALPGVPPALRMGISPSNTLLGGTAQISVTGAEFFDYDLNGDGIFESTGDQTGVVAANTSNTGLIRPVVRGRSAGGAESFASLNILVSGSSRPLAVGSATPTSGQVPLPVQFSGTGTDDDGEIVAYAWDFEGDGTYDYFSEFSASPPLHVYALSGMYNARFRVTDDSGSFDVDTVAILVESGVVGSAPSEWSMFGKDRSNSRRSDFPGTQSKQLQWSFDAGDIIRSSAAIGRNGMVVFGCSDGKVYAVNALGTKIWEFPAGGPVLSSPSIGLDGTVYIGSDAGQMLALDQNGNKVWQFNASGIIQGSPAVGPDGSIYLPCFNGRLYKVSPGGSKRWEFQADGSLGGCPAVTAEGVVYFGGFDGFLYCVNDQGLEEWRFPTESAIEASPAIGDDGTIYFCSGAGSLFALNEEGGKLWEFETEGSISASPALGADGTIYISSHDDFLYAVTPQGNEDWRFDTGGGGNSSPSVSSDGTIYIGSSNNSLYAVRPDGSQLWSYSTGGIISGSPAIARTGLIYIGGRDGVLYAIGEPVEDSGEGA